MNHQKMRRILDKYFRVAGRSLTVAWDGIQPLQDYFNIQGVTNVTAIALIAKENDYDIWMSGKPDREKDNEATAIMTDRRFKALALVCAKQFNMTPAQMKTAIKAKL